MIVAEREGFEPPVRLHVLRISSAARSTTLPPLRGARETRVVRRRVIQKQGADGKGQNGRRREPGALAGEAEA